MRKTAAITRARVESHRDKCPVELWSRAQIMPAGIVRPRAPRNWILRSTKGETDQDILDRQRELVGRGFRFERTIEEGGEP